jgi:hypothetical protein
MSTSTRTQLFWAPLLAGLLVLAPGTAAATEGEDFRIAREAYDRGEYSRAVALFEPMVGADDPSIDDTILIRESRQYLAAAYVLTGERERAAQQFAWLLRDEGEDFADYRLNPRAFPEAVLRVFNEVRDRLIEEADANRERRDAELLAREQQRREAGLRLVAIAEEDEVEIRHDPAIAWLPFGAGQFQNGNQDLGVFFSVAESIMLATSIGAMSGWIVLNDQYQDSLEFRGPAPDLRLLQALQITNWVAFGAFGAIAVAGIIEAHVNFVPSHRERRRREVPHDVIEQLDLYVGPTSITARVRF